MSYATVTDFIREFGLAETTELLADETNMVTTENIKYHLNDVEITDADELAAVRYAVERLESMLAEAAKLMNGYIAKAARLPLSEATIAAAPVKTCNLELARCQLMEDADNGTELSEKRCKRWLEWLKDLASGKTTLSNKQAATASCPVRQGYSVSKYDWGAYP